MRRFIGQFCEFARRATLSKRTHSAVVSTALSSISNLLISIGIARNATIGEMAEFSVAFAVFIVTTGMTRAMIAEPIAARLLPVTQFQRSGSEVSLLALILNLVAALIGAILQQPYMLAGALAGHGLILGDYAKYVSVAFGNPFAAMLQEAARLLGIIGLLFLIPASNQPLTIFIGWAALSAIVGYAAIWTQKISVIPRMRHSIVGLQERGSYGADYLLGQGTAQVITFILAGAASPAVVAALRGAGTILGPVTVVATSVRSLIIPFISRGIHRRAGFVSSINASLALAVVAAPLLIAVNLMPYNWGVQLLGETWTVAAPILTILSVEVFFTLQSNVPFSGHRSLMAHRRTLNIRLVLAPVRIGLVVFGAIYAGVTGAATGMLVGSIASTLTWWTSYILLLRNHKH